MHADILRGRLIELIHMYDEGTIGQAYFMTRLRELVTELETH